MVPCEQVIKEQNDRLGELLLERQTLRADLAASVARAERAENEFREYCIYNADNKEVADGFKAYALEIARERDAVLSRAERAESRVKQLELVLLGRIENAHQYFIEHGSYANPKPLPYDMQGE